MRPLGHDEKAPALPKESGGRHGPYFRSHLTRGLPSTG